MLVTVEWTNLREILVEVTILHQVPFHVFVANVLSAASAFVFTVKGALFKHVKEFLRYFVFFEFFLAEWTGDFLLCPSRDAVFAENTFA